MSINSPVKLTDYKAFSLIEVVLAMGIFLMTVLAMVGLLGPALKSVSTVKQTDEVASVVASVNAFLNTSPYIDKPNPNDSRFAAIYNAIENDEDYAVLFIYRWYDNDNDVVRQEIGFEDDQNSSVNSKSVVNENRGDGIPAASFDRAVSPIYRVVLTASSAMASDPDNIVAAGAQGSYPQYTLSQAIDAYGRNYLALEVRIFAEDLDSFNSATNIATLANEVPIFTYDTAILSD